MQQVWVSNVLVRLEQSSPVCCMIVCGTHDCLIFVRVSASDPGLDELMTVPPCRVGYLARRRSR